MPLAVVVMGVSGCGKTSVVTVLAEQTGWRAVDADDLHTDQSVAKMRSGRALDDDDRFPWLDRIGMVLAESLRQGQGVLVACSALRRIYRDRLRAACPSVRFVFLDGGREIIAQRLASRKNHYMPTSLLDSQLRTLERPGSDEADVVSVDSNQSLGKVVQQALAALTASDQSTSTDQ